MHHPLAFTSTLFILAIAACAPAPPEKADPPPVAAAPAPATAPAASASAQVLGLVGLGDLRIGQPPPATWGEAGAQIDDGCRTITSKAYPGVYAIVTDGKVQRLTVGQRSDLKLIEGIGVGATEQDVRRAFSGFREEPHKYEDKPAKYLTAPNAGPDAAALRFEIGADGKVRLIHIGLMPVLEYVEGCA